MATNDFSRDRGTPAQYANRRALHPWAIVTAVLILLGIVAVGKVSWAVNAFELQAKEYGYHRLDR